jgi:N-methylhydantoinase A
MRLGVDIGGTFTDFVWVDAAGKVRLHKRLTTPDDPARSVVEGAAELGVPADPAAQVVHGSTIATNALLERRGARTALITTLGFADVLEIGRQNRPDLYALVPHRPSPLVPREWRFELPERLSAQGDVLIPLDPQAVLDLIPRLQAAQIESVAVCFLFSYLRPEHEQMVQRILEAGSWRLDQLAPASSFQPLASYVYISLSSNILPEYREYERTATTVINAYVTPVMDRYLARLEAQLAPRSLRVMQSNGGCLTAASARRQAARTALSGPAGGAVGAFAVAREAAAATAAGSASPEAGPNIISFDMGGTSTDVCLCPGRLPYTSEGQIAALGLPLRLPIIDIHTVGAGGGSLARLDLGGALTVGPQSAGADPGPACYGRGGRVATVTDANLALNRLHPDHFLGGRMRLDASAAQAALEPLAEQLGGPRSQSGSHHAAWGIIQVANAAMERAIRKISVERGYDPAGFTLVAFGGAGPLHACELAARLSIPRVLVPRAPGVLSALGMLVADLVQDYSTTVLRPVADLAPAGLSALFGSWETRALAEMEAEVAAAGTGAAPRLERSADLRYVGQSFEINVPVPPGPPNPAALQADFHARHEQRYGHSHPTEPVEVVNLRVRAIGATPALAFEPIPASGPDPSLASLGQQPAWFETSYGRLEALPAALYDREALRPGNRVSGPAILFQLDATTVIPPGWQGQVDEFGHLLLEFAAR